MTTLRKPWFRAFIAASYIVFFALAIRWTGDHVKDTLDPAVGITAFLSAFVFSAALMAYLFFFESVRLVMAGDIRAGIEQFARTFGWFFAFAIVAVAALFFALG